ncbi:PfkB family carbohydrate kinase [Streptomyces sp. CSDS2]|uniref:PfkB family carbohydrate kinase n=1 Tax=Streptomyces sp. CSDS2 TaxID=3055051 RepID=UPI0025B2101C|nr:PfkB family carbohydrate kinase [Streptomyces sp. CSDS2]MDN3258437.1 PfkB family carbohydrate kinase [Streptomyces sp. CSDS2]
MRIAVAGSIATDHLMVFPGRFADQLLEGRLAAVSLSFLADRVEVRRGGVGATIALGLARLGLRPLLVGAAGADFAGYGRWLADAGVDTSGVRVSATLPTARFVRTTDEEQNRIVAFHPGAMSEAHRIDIAEAHRRRRIGLILVGADDPAAMLRHTATAHRLGIPVVADPSRQLAGLDAEEARSLVTGARCLLTDACERALLLERTGWSEQDVLRRVGTWAVTHGAEGVRLLAAGQPPVEVPAVAARRVAGPAGGDGLRAGFLAGLFWGLPPERAAQLGCAVATAVPEFAGTEEYRLVPADLLASVERGYGGEAARELAARLDPATVGAPA